MIDQSKSSDLDFDNLENYNHLFDSNGKKYNFVRKILNLILLLINIIFYPFVWIIKEVGRMVSFLRYKNSHKDDPLSHIEISLVESFPVFFLIFGIVIAFVMSTLLWIDFKHRLDDIISSLSNGFSSIQNFLNLIDSLASGIFSFLSNSSQGLINFISNDAILILIVVSIFAFFFGLFYLFFSESGILKRFVFKMKLFTEGITKIPKTFYDKFDLLWLRLLKSAGRFLAGGNSITGLSKKFYHRILGSAVVYAIIVFSWGIFLLLNELRGPNNQLINLSDPTNAGKAVGAFLFLIYLYILTGFLAGTLYFYLSIRVLKIMSQDKYKVDIRKIKVLRHQELVQYMLKKGSKYNYLQLQYLSVLFDIPLEEFPKHWNDKRLSDWKLYNKYAVNQTAFNKKVAKIELLEQQALEKEKLSIVILALDYLSYVNKLFGKIKELSKELEFKKTGLLSDISKIRGET